MTILGQAESFEMMNRPDLTVTLFESLFLGNCKIGERKILTRPSIELSICVIKIFNR